jgi:hypothetical protein
VKLWKPFWNGQRIINGLQGQSVVQNGSNLRFLGIQFFWKAFWFTNTIKVFGKIGFWKALTNEKICFSLCIERWFKNEHHYPMSTSFCDQFWHQMHRISHWIEQRQLWRKKLCVSNLRNWILWNFGAFWSIHRFERFLTNIYSTTSAK